jgi:excisionase family DNA binding protein
MIIDGITYITVKEAAAIIGVGQSRVRQFIMQGRLTTRKVGDYMNVLPLAEVQAFARMDRPAHKHIEKPGDYE